MLIGRFLYRQKVCFGIIEHDIHLLHDNIYNRLERTGKRISRDKVSFLPPVEPPMIIGLGRSYTSHVKEMAVDPPERPAIFLSLAGQLSHTLSRC